MSSFFGSGAPAQLVRRNGSKVPTSEALQSVRYVLVYFSAHWCPPCRGFTPQLKQFHEANAKAKNFEVVFVSLDHTEQEMESYFTTAHGDWLAVPYAEGKTLGQQWMQLYGLWGIPSLLVFENVPGGARRLITAQGRSMVPADMDAAQFPWTNADQMVAEANQRMKRRGLMVLAVIAIVLLYIFYK